MSTRSFVKGGIKRSIQKCFLVHSGSSALSSNLSLRQERLIGRIFDWLNEVEEAEGESYHEEKVSLTTSKVHSTYFYPTSN